MNEESEDPRLTTMSGGSVAQRFVGFAAAAAAAVSLCCESPALAEYLTVAFPVSRTHEVNTVQRTLVFLMKQSQNVYLVVLIFQHLCVRNYGDILCDKCTHGRIALTVDENAQRVRVCGKCMAEVTQRLSHAKESASKPTGLHSHEVIHILCTL